VCSACSEELFHTKCSVLRNICSAVPRSVLYMLFCTLCAGFFYIHKNCFSGAASFLCSENLSSVFCFSKNYFVPFVLFVLRTVINCVFCVF
jgi:hypothetical protein